MNTANRVIFNTAVLYVKIVVNMLISLVSVPLIMHALGVSDYGLYNLIAGVIGMLAFLNASMTVSTQRYLSVSIGERNQEKSNRIYNNAILLHLFLGLICVILFEVCAPFLFNGFLNIEPDKVATAEIIYQLLVVTTFATIITVPYVAVMNAKENMLAFSILGIVDALLKLALAVYLSYCPFDRLIFYGIGMMGISIVNMLFNREYVHVKYKEYKRNFRSYYDRTTFREMFGFMGWNTFGSVAVIGRNQGIAIILNRFCGTVLNAAYGVANQINGVLGYFSNTFNKSINPQLMQSEGMKDRDRLIRISFVSSKFSVLVLALFIWPLIIEMPYVLMKWLKEPPAYTTILSSTILIFSLVYQYSMGLMSAIQATGRIRNYQITMGILILLNVPLSYVFLKMGMPPYYTTIGFIIIEVISLLVRLFFARSLVGVRIHDYFQKVLLPTIVVMSLASASASVPHIFMPESLVRLIVVYAVYMVVFCLSVWFLALNNAEKAIFINLYNRVRVARNSID